MIRKRFILHLIAVVSAVALLTATSYGAEKKGKSKKETAHTVENVDVQKLNERINILIETNKQQTAVIQNQEGEIQRLTSIINKLRQELEQTTANLKATAHERDALAIRLKEVMDKINTVRNVIGTIDISSTTPSPDTLPASQSMGDSKEQNGVNKSIDGVSQKDSLQKEGQLNKTGTEQARPPVTLQKSDVPQNTGQSDSHVMSQTGHQAPSTFAVTPENEKLINSIAVATYMTGRPVYIQHGDFGLVGKLSKNGDKCDVTVDVVKDNAVVLRKKVNACNETTAGQ